MAFGLGISSPANSGFCEENVQAGSKHPAFSLDKVAANINPGLNNSDVPIKKEAGIDEAAKIRVQETYGKLPLSFIKNSGQMDKKVKYYERGSGHSTYFTKEGVYLELTYSEQPTVGSKQEVEGNLKLETGNSELRTPKSPIANRKSEIVNPTPNPELPNLKSEVIKLIPLNANKDTEIIAEGLQEGKINYFTDSDPEKWKINIHTHKAVVYEGIYDGIDMKFYGNNRQMEYDIIVKPGADLSQVQLS